MEELENRIKEVFENYCAEYRRIFERKSRFKPWANEKGYSIHEANQVANFLSFYRHHTKVSEDCVTWMEFAIPYKKGESSRTNHVDGLILDGNKVVFIEAKRFSRVDDKKTELKDDLKSLCELTSDEGCINKLKDRVSLGCGEFYCLLLVDYWVHRRSSTWKRERDEIEIATLKEKWKIVVNEYKDELSVLHKDLDVSDEDFDVQMIWDGNYHLAYALFKLKDF